MYGSSTLESGCTQTCSVGKYGKAIGQSTEDDACNEIAMSGNAMACPLGHYCDVDEVQRLRITATDSNEIQHLEITETRHTQMLSFAGKTKDAKNYTISGGEFRLTYFNEIQRSYTSCLSYLITSTDLATAIVSLTGINNIQVTVTGSLSTNDKEFKIVFPQSSTPYALSIDRQASYPEFIRGDHAGRDGAYSCKRAYTFAGEFISITIPNAVDAYSACSDANLPIIETYGTHELNDDDIVMLSYKTVEPRDIALHNYMFKVGVIDNTHFTIASDFSGTQNNHFGMRSTPGPEDHELFNEPGDFIRILQPSIITSISDGRDNGNSNTFEEQIVTTKDPHGYESGDIIQLSLHYQVDAVGLSLYDPNPQSISWRTRSLYYGMMHGNLFEVDRKTDTTFSLFRLEYINNITPSSNNANVHFMFTANMQMASRDYIALIGHTVEIECYECGVTGFDAKTFTIVGAKNITNHIGAIEVANAYNLNFSAYDASLSDKYALMKFKTSHDIRPGGANFKVGFIDEVQTITISEGRAKQILYVSDANLAGNNINEIQTITISETRAKQIVNVVNENLHGNNGNEVQTITISDTFKKQVLVITAGSSISAGSYILSYKGQDTACIAYDTIQTGVKNALELLSTLTTVEVTRIINGHAYQYTLEITNPNTNVEAITVHSIGTGSCTAFVCGGTTCTDHAVTNSHTGSLGTFDGGQFFTVAFDGCPLCRSEATNTTGNIDWTRDTSGQSNENSLQSKLNELPNIANLGSDAGTLGVTVFRSALSSSTMEGYVFTIRFQGSYVPGNMPLLRVASNNLGNQSTSDGDITINIAKITSGYHPGFKLTYDGETTDCIAWDESGDKNVVGLERRLQDLSNIISIASVTQSSITNGYAYTIIFANPSAPISLQINTTISGCDAMPNGVDHSAVVSLDTTHGIGTFNGGQHFTLSFAGCPLCRTTTTETTSNIDWTQDTSGQSNINSLQSQLNGLTNIANSASDAGTLGVTVIRSDVGNNNEGYIFSITFQGSYVPGNVPTLIAVDNNLGGQITTDSNNGAVSITIQEVTPGLTPGFRLKYNNQQTGCIAWDEDGDTSIVGIEARLEALSAITNLASVTKTTIANGYAYTIIFAEPSAPQTLVVGSNSGCDNMPTDAVTLDTTHGLGTFAGGQNFTLSYNGLTTGDIDWTQDTAGQSNINSLQSKLNALSNIANSVSDSGALGVAVTRSNLNSATNNNEGYIFSVTFKGLNVKGNVPLLSLASNTLGGQVTTDGNISIVINEQREGYTPGNRLGYAGIIVPRQKIVSENLGGTFTLNFDTSGVPPNNEWKCRVCSIHENVFSGAINPLQSDQSQVDSLQYVLNEMTNIGVGNVAVSYTRTQNGRTTKRKCSLQNHFLWEQS